MSFGYPTQYANGLNSNSQIRRSTDMIYQRGGTYEVILTGSTYNTTLELDVDLYSDDVVVGRMQLVPYDVSYSASTYTYKFNIRPYEYLSNYVEAQHYKYYWYNDWYNTSETININNPYPNIIKANIKYGYKYLTGNTVVTEYTGSPTNDYDHYTSIPECAISTGFTASGFTNTGEYFNLIGGSFQFSDHYILPNFDQEVGTTVTENSGLYTLDVNRRLSPMSQYMIDGPSVPEMSETARFLTDAPRIQTIQESENYVLSFLNGLTGDRQFMEADFALFEFYDDSNNLLTYFSQFINFSGTTYATPTTGYTNTLKIFNLPCGPKDIKMIYQTGLDFSNVAYYRVQLFYGYPTDGARGGTGPIGPSSEAFYFYLYDNCQPENTRLAFLNARGGFDYFTFTSYRQDTKKISRQTYDNRYYATNLQSPDRDFGRSVKTFATDIDREFVLESDFLNVQYGEWLQQLFYSPQVYEVKEDYISPMDRQDKVYKDLRPVQILSTEVQTITKKHKKLNKYRITLKYADTFFVNKGF